MWALTQAILLIKFKNKCNGYVGEARDRSIKSLIDAGRMVKAQQSSHQSKVPHPLGDQIKFLYVWDETCTVYYIDQVKSRKVFWQ
jgi:hypothetical protein